MGSVSQPFEILSISYAELVHDDPKARHSAAGEFAQALRDSGLCLIRDHGIPQHKLDDCFRKSRAFFNRDLKTKIADHRYSGLTSNARFVPFGSEQVRGEPHLDETIEFNYGVYDLAPTDHWSLPGRELMDISKSLHEECIRVAHSLIDCLSQSSGLSTFLASIHGPKNTFFAPYYYYFPDDEDNRTLRVPPHIDPTTMLFCFQDSLAGLQSADMRDLTGNLSSTAVAKKAAFYPVKSQPGEFVVLAGHILRKLVGDIKHSVHRVERPVGSEGLHLNFWIVPQLDTRIASGRTGEEEEVRAYLNRVFPGHLGDP
ncbi:hypothetical protein BDW72DRAFT_133111 [Aspergillus terricola var. indicus]